MASTSPLLKFLTPLFPSNPTPTPKITKLPLPSSSSSSSKPITKLSTNNNNTKEQKGLVGPTKEECPGDLMAVVCPSLAFSNTLFFRSAYNVQVLVDDTETEEKLLNRFRREVMRAGVIQECKRRRFFENKQDEFKRKSREAAKRNSRRRNFQSQGVYQNKEETSKVVKKDEEEDNWELPEGDTLL